MPTYQPRYRPFIDRLLPEWVDIAGFDGLEHVLGPQISQDLKWFCPGCGYVFTSHETMIKVHQRVHEDYRCPMDRLKVRAIPAYDLARRAAALTDERRAELGLDSV